MAIPGKVLLGCAIYNYFIPNLILSKGVLTSCTGGLYLSPNLSFFSNSNFSSNFYLYNSSSFFYLIFSYIIILYYASSYSLADYVSNLPPKSI